MKVIVPLSIKAIPSHFGGAEKPRVIEIAFSYEVGPSVVALRLLMHAGSKLLQERIRGDIQNSMESIKSEGVDVEFLYPV